ncbi:MAG: GTP-binding protein [Thermodesulfobacteriota bacterium]
MRLLLISGFLGSGKTTLLLEIARRLAADSGKIAIIENEVGEVGIDGQYLRREGLEVQEMFGGCICCTLSVDLVTTLKKLHQSVGPARVILEATGVARPGDIVPTVRRYAPMVDEIQVLVLLDGPRYEMLLEVMNPLVTAQIGAADIAVINKIDEMDEAGIDRVRRSVNDLNEKTRVVAISAEQQVNLEDLMGALQ